MTAKFSAFVRTCVLTSLIAMYANVWIFTLSQERRKYPWYYFLTMWNFFFQTLYSVFAVISSAAELTFGLPIFSKVIIESIISYAITPLSSFVVIVFWAMFLYDVSTPKIQIDFRDILCYPHFGTY